MSGLLALPAPARFKLNRSIKLGSPSEAANMVSYWQTELRNALAHEAEAKRNHRYLHCWKDSRQCAESLKVWQDNLDCAEWTRDYAAQHDCSPTILDKREDAGQCSRYAKVQVENDIYHVTVRVGRRAMGMYGKRGNKWHVWVRREGTDRQLLEGEYCPKSQGLGSEAVRQHLFRLWRITRGIKEVRR